MDADARWASRLKKTIVCTIGTRPEAIKMAPVIQAFHAAPWARCRVVLTGQHRELVDEVLDVLRGRAARRPGCHAVEAAARSAGRHLVEGTLSDVFARAPDMVLAQGDTTTRGGHRHGCFSPTRLPFGHVEAGLRTQRLFAPFPEEANRVVASHLSAIHFAPTTSARQTWREKESSRRTIFVTGNTVIDALLATAGRDIPIGVELDPSQALGPGDGAPPRFVRRAARRICRAIQDSMSDSRKSSFSGRSIPIRRSVRSWKS